MAKGLGLSMSKWRPVKSRRRAIGSNVPLTPCPYLFNYFKLRNGFCANLRKFRVMSAIRIFLTQNSADLARNYAEINHFVAQGNLVGQGVRAMGFLAKNKRFKIGPGR